MPLAVLERHHWHLRGAVFDRGCDDFHPTVTHITHLGTSGFGQRN